MENDIKGCALVIIGFLLFAFIGKLLYYIIEKWGNVLSWIIMAAIFIPFIGFIIMCIRGMKKEEDEDV